MRKDVRIGYREGNRDVEKRIYSQKGGHLARGNFRRAQNERSKYFPGLYFRTIEAPIEHQDQQTAWVRRLRQPGYDGR